MPMLTGSGAGGGGGGWLAQEIKKTTIKTIKSLFTLGLPPIE
jgi:hypothetical protein